MYFILGILHASIVVKIDIFVLLCLSISIWAAFFNKINRLNIIKSYSDSFEKHFWSGVTLEEFYEANKASLSHPLGIIFSGAMKEWIISQSSKNPNIIEQLKNGTRERIFESIDHSKIKIREILSKYQTFFLTVTSLAPLLGLFGTVCGIINTFYSVALEGNSNISIIAPGVSEALITTAFSIIVAICAAIMYNFFNVKISQIENRAELFSIDLINVLSRELDMLSIKNAGGGIIATESKIQSPNPPAIIEPKQNNSSKKAPPKQTSFIDDDI